MNPGVAACWIAVSKDGRFLYDSNSVTPEHLGVLDQRDGWTLKFVQRSTAQVHGDERLLWRSIRAASGCTSSATTTTPTRPDPRVFTASKIVPAPLPANYLDAYNINPKTGMLSEIATVKIPVPAANLPYGIDILPKS